MVEVRKRRLNFLSICPLNFLSIEKNNMKKLIAKILPLSAVVMPSLAFGLSLISNPSFEGSYITLPSGSGQTIVGKYAEGWTENSAWTRAEMVYDLDTTNPHTGKSSQKITLQAAGSGGTQLSQWPVLKGGHTYVASAWLRSDNPTTVSFVNGSEKGYFGNWSVPVSKDWQQVFINIPLGGTAGADISTQLWIGMENTSATIWVDDVSLYDVTPGANILNNGDFEKYSPVPGPLTPPPKITGDIATGWQDNSAWTTATIKYSKNTGKSGSSQQIKYESSGTNGEVRFQQILDSAKLVYGHLYNAHVWLKADKNTTVGFWLQLNGQIYLWKDVSLAAGTWIEASFATQIDVDASSSGATFAIVISPKSPGVTIQVDDISFVDATPPLPVTPVSNEFFGMHFALGYGTPPDTVPWPSNFVGLYRLWDCGVMWRTLQPLSTNAGSDVSKWNQANLNLLKTLVDTTLNNKAVPVMTLGQTPDWATTYRSASAPYGQGAPGHPKDLKYWRDYVTGLAKAFKGKVRLWEIWNEPGPDGSLSGRFYAGTAAQLVTLYQEAYTILKTTDPSNQIICPASSDVYLEQFLAAKGGDFCDIMNFHTYLNTYKNFPQTPEDILSEMGSVRLSLEKYKIYKPLWNTEQGWYNFESYEDQYSDPSRYAVDTPEAYVARTYLLNWAYGMEGRLGWYRWENIPGHESIHLTTNAQGKELTVAGLAQKVVSEWLRGGVVMTSLTRVAKTKDTWLITIERPYIQPNYRGYILWNRSQTSTNYKFPNGSKIMQKRDLKGGVTPSSVPIVDVSVGIKPVLYENEAPK